MRCAPRVLTARDTLRITFAGAHGGELSIENPQHVVFYLVSVDPTPEHGPQLMTADALQRARVVRLAGASLRALPYVYGASDTVAVFQQRGTYRVRVAERLQTDDGTPVQTCVVRVTR